MRHFGRTGYGRLLIPLAPLLVLTALVAAFWPVALLLAAPWLIVLVVVAVRSPWALQDDAPSTAQAALRRLSAR